MPIKILDNEYATLWYYPEDRIIHHRLKKFIFGERFRGLMTAGADAFENYGCHKYLSDDRDMSAFHPDDVAWSSSTYMPRMLKTGWTHWALIPSKRVIGQVSIAHLIENLRRLGIVIEFFSDVEEALAWLKTQ